MIPVGQDAVVVLDRTGRLVFANPEAEAVLGRPLSQAAGRPLPEVLGSEHPLFAVLTPADPGRPRTALHYAKFEGPDGSARELRLASYPVHDGARVTGTVILIQDLEPVNAVRSLVEYSTRLAELGGLTSGVAHEVRNPLNAIAIHLELLRRQLPPGATTAEQSLAVVDREMRRLDRIVQGFVGFLRPARLSLTPVTVADLLRDARATVQPEADRAQVRLVSVVAPGAPSAVMGDAGLLREALANLLRNALQAMPQDGRVVLRAARTPAGEVELRVEDHGVGIPADALEKVFRLYYTTRPEGQGLGLSVVYRIVQMHGGRIRLESREGQGTTAIIALPASLVPALEPST